MPTITIDTRSVTVPEGKTVLESAALAGIHIPSLCWMKGYAPNTSCFVCVVKIEGREGLVPSCAVIAEEGMVIESETNEIRAYRQQALELLLSEHAGDCEAPCRRICPCSMDIPAMLRSQIQGDFEGLCRVLYREMPFPGILGKVCPAPCQKGCRRGRIDTPIEIKNLHFLELVNTDLVVLVKYLKI